jgi:zeaxanthin glucosyltransferase
MTHFGIFCPGTYGHLNPMCNLGRELMQRGHQVTLFGLPDVADKVTKAGLNFYEIGAADFPRGKMVESLQQLGELDGLPALKFSIAFFLAESAMLIREAPIAIQSAGVEALIIDQISLSVGTVADRLKLPFVTVYNALLLNREPGVPPFSTTWAYQDNVTARLRNRLGNALIARLTNPLWQLIVQQREAWQLPPQENREAAVSQLAQICQMPAALDFPRKNLPTCLHYIGQLQAPVSPESANSSLGDFPWERLTGQPLIYASLGTLQNRNWQIFESIATACEGLDAQLVVALGNPNQDINQVKLAGNPIVVSYAPQQQLIDRATLVITHAGLNTTLDALSAGVPMVAIPITNDQPGVAARMVRTGSGLLIPVKKVTVDRLRFAITKVLNDQSFKNNAMKMQADIQAAGGVPRAADIIEQAISTGQPVLNQSKP